MDPEKIIQEAYNVAFSKPTGDIKELNEVCEMLDVIMKLIPEELVIKLDNLIGQYSARCLEDGYRQGFKDGSKLMVYLLKED